MIGSKRYIAIFLTLALALLPLGVRKAEAHPHVFVDNIVEFVFDDEGLAGIQLDWLFDDMFGETMLVDFDLNRDGKFTPTELAELKKGGFDHLKNFGYFTHLELDGRKLPITTVSNFEAGTREGRLFYRFFIPMPIKGDASHKLLMSVHDTEYYAEIFTDEDAEPVLTGGKGFAPKASVFLNSEKTYSLFSVWTTEVTLTFGS